MSEATQSEVDNAPRLFLALWPDDTTRAALARCRDEWNWSAAAKPQPDERLHMTLHFLGHVPARRMTEVLEGLTVPPGRLALDIEHAEVWPKGAAVATPGSIPSALLALHAALHEKLERMALAPEPRRYRPHITLARDASGSIVPAAPRPVHWQANGYVLVESKSHVYTVLHNYS